MVNKSLRIVIAALALALAASDAGAQEPAGEIPDRVGPYTVTSSVEVGVRGVKVEGDEDKYRSDLNYQPGFQFLDSSLLLKSEGGDAPLFDSLLVKITGWDSDPSGYLRVDAEKLDAYRFNGTVRRVNYYNALGNLALKQHRDDTEHTFGAFNLVLRPQSRSFRPNFEYAFDRSNGQSLTTYDYSRDEFPIFAPTRVRSDTFSAGFDATFGKVDLSFQQGYRSYRDDTTFFVTGFEPGNSGPGVPTFLTSFERDLPTRGRIHFSRLNVHTFLNEMVDVTGRFVYSHSRTRSTLFETLTGANFLGNFVTPDQFVGRSSAERPNVLADVGVSVMATDKLTVSNTFRLNWFEIDGEFDLTETIRSTARPGNPPVPPLTVLQTLSSRLTDYRLFSNLLEIDYEFHPQVSAHVGYRYTDRSIDLEPLDLDFGEAPPDERHVETFDNRTNTFIFGLRAKPVRKGWTLYFDLERGENDNVFTRVSNYDYTSIRLRNRIQLTDELAMNVSAIAKNNENPSRTEDLPPVNFGANTETRIVSASADWTPNSRFTLSSGYTHTRITSDAVVIFFFNFQRRQGLSEYYMRDNFAFVNVNARLHPRVGLYAGYRIHDDRGAGDREAPSPDVLISSYPYRYQTPEVRLAVRLNDRLDWNVGYQYYRFEERFQNLNPGQILGLQDYSAHLPYTSLRFYFGRTGR